MMKGIGAALLTVAVVIGACAIGGSANVAAAERQQVQAAPATDISARRYYQHDHHYAYRPYYPYYYGRPYYYSPGPFFPFPWFTPAPLVWW